VHTMISRYIGYGSALAAALYLFTAACSSDPAAGGGAGTAGGGAGTAGGGAGTAGGGAGTAGGGGAPAASGEATANAVAAAQAWLDSLDATQLALAQLDFTSTQKAVWSNYPISDVARNGVRTGDMTDAQLAGALAVLEATLSEAGYQRVIDIMNADEVVCVGETRFVCGNDNYTLAIFGTPSTTSPWMLQYNGHHLALNVTIVGNDMTMAPSLLGTQPSSFTRDGATVRPMGDETDKGFAMINALAEARRAEAIIGTTGKDLVLGPGQDGKVLTPEGSPVSGWTAEEQALLIDLIGVWVDNLNDDAAAVKMAEVAANLATTYFAWSGPITAGSVVYYRIQGPTLLIEFSDQMRSADHVHAMFRDPTNDYGAALIAP
jgi:Protein of unknown function (DUF3500)